MTHRRARKVAPPITRFSTKYVVAENGCWLWTGKINQAGYPCFSVQSNWIYAHRWSYEHHVGPVPEGLEVDHKCHTLDRDCPGGRDCSHRRCVNPEHLEAVTQRENVGRSRPATKTHCANGHEFTPANTYTRPEGWRQCRRCAAERHHRRTKTFQGVPLRTGNQYIRKSPTSSPSTSLIA